MPPKKVVEEPPEEPEEPPPPPPPTEDEVTELETGLQLPLRGNDVGQIWALGEDYEGQAKLLAGLLGLAQAYPSAPRRNIVCDFYMYNLAHAKSLCLTKRQGAVFHAIMDRILTLMKGPEEVSAQGKPQDMGNGPAECFKEFQQLLLQHSVNRPPQQEAIFKVSEAKMLTDFASATLFKHFLLYQFCLNCPQEVQTLRFRSGVMRPLPPPDLSCARLRPRRKSQEESSGGAGAGGEPGGDGAAADDAGSGAGEEPSPEDEEVRRMVEEKLRETEAALQAKLDAREAAFLDKLAARPKGAAKKK